MIADFPEQWLETHDPSQVLVAAWRKLHQHGSAVSDSHLHDGFSDSSSDVQSDSGSDASRRITGHLTAGARRMFHKPSHWQQTDADSDGRSTIVIFQSRALNIYLPVEPVSPKTRVQSRGACFGQGLGVPSLSDGCSNRSPNYC